MNLSRRTATGLIAATTVLPLAPAAAQAQSDDVISLLEREHAAAKRLMNRILASNDPSERARLFRQLADALTIHNANEENIVYPSIRDAAHRPADAATLYHQQDDAKVIIWELMPVPKDSARFTSRFRDLRAAILDHIRQEEQIDFPALRAALGPRMRDLDVATAHLRSHWVAGP